MMKGRNFSLTFILEITLEAFCGIIKNLACGVCIGPPSCPQRNILFPMWVESVGLSSSAILNVIAIHSWVYPFIDCIGRP